MAVICHICAATNRDGARYCDQCAASLSADSGPLYVRAIELRQGTVLFCDLVRSTELANSLDADDLRGVFRRFREIVAEVTRKHSGHIIQFSGDGAFVLFGYPRASEDAAEAALDAALALVQHVRQASTSDVALDLRVGVASGTVVTGELQKEAASYEESIVGSVVHLAARLVSKAQPGRVVIDDATRRLAGRFFEYRDIGRLRLKGFAEDVQAWLVLRASSISSRFEAKHADRSLPAIVGRAGPLASLRECWARAVKGECTTVILRGDAGLGKSRLAREVRREALQFGAVVLDIDCSPRTAHTPLSPVSTLLRRLVGKAPRDSVAAVTRARTWVQGVLGNEAGDRDFPYLAPLMGVDAPPANAAESPERFRERMIAVLVDVVRALAATQPLFVLCEDAHWSDATTLELVTRAGSALSSLPILVVVTARSAREADWSPVEIPNAVTISLSPLEADDAAELVRMGALGGSLPPATIQQIVTRCEGNPLYLEEATRSALEGTDEAGSDGSHGRRDVPTSLQGLVQARLDRWPSAKPVIQAASILGRDFTLPLLQLLLPERLDVPQAIALLVDRDLLVRDGARPSEGLRFRHALIHEAVYRTVVRSERQRLHSRAADMLVQYFGGQAEAMPDVLAHHFAAAQRYEEATRALAEACDLATARAAHVESIGHSRAALGITEHIRDDRIRRQLQRRVLIRLSVALAAIQGYASEEVLKTYNQARDLCAAQDDPEDLFPIVRGLGTFYFVRGDMLEAAGLSEQCLELARRSGCKDLLIEALSFKGYTDLYRGRLRECRRALEECLAVYEAEHGERFVYPSAQDPATAAWSLLMTAMWLQGDAHAAEAGATKLLAHVERLRRPFDEAYARVWIAGLRQLQRRLDDALYHANIGIEIAQTHGYTMWLTASMMMASMATALRTPSPESIDVLRRTHSAFRQAGADINASFYLWGIARALALTGDTERARAAIADAMRLAELGGETYMNAELIATEAELHTDDARQIECLTRALRIAEDQGAVAVALRIASTFVQRCGSHGRPDSGQAGDVLRMLDGTATCPSSDGWMSEALTALKRELPLAGTAPS